MINESSSRINDNISSVNTSRKGLCFSCHLQHVPEVVVTKLWYVFTVKLYILYCHLIFFYILLCVVAVSAGLTCRFPRTTLNALLFVTTGWKSIPFAGCFLPNIRRIISHQPLILVFIPLSLSDGPSRVPVLISFAHLSTIYILHPENEANVSGG